MYTVIIYMRYMMLGIVLSGKTKIDYLYNFIPTGLEYDILKFKYVFNIINTKCKSSNNLNLLLVSDLDEQLPCDEYN